MGIVADIPNCIMEFRNPKNEDVFNPIANTCRCVMHMFYVKFGFTFDSDPAHGAGGSDPAFWQIGIVQNVIYEKLKFKYSDGALFKADWTTPVLDSGAAIDVGFYHDPVKVPACQVNPELKCTQWLPVISPVTTVVYDKSGYGELMALEGGPDLSTAPEMVDMIDEPAFGARMRIGKAVVTEAEHILAFQIWLVAKHREQVKILAYIEPFSLVFVLAAQPKPDALSIHTPPFQFNFYAVRGITRTAKMKSQGEATIRVFSGASKNKPIMDGQTANARGRAWLTANHLLPE